MRRHVRRQILPGQIFSIKDRQIAVDLPGSEFLKCIGLNDIVVIAHQTVVIRVMADDIAVQERLLPVIQVIVILKIDKHRCRDLVLLPQIERIDIALIQQRKLQLRLNAEQIPPAVLPARMAAQNQHMQVSRQNRLRLILRTKLSHGVGTARTVFAHVLDQIRKLVHRIIAESLIAGAPDQHADLKIINLMDKRRILIDQIHRIGIENSTRRCLAAIVDILEILIGLLRPAAAESPQPRHDDGQFPAVRILPAHAVIDRIPDKKRIVLIGTDQRIHVQIVSVIYRRNIAKLLPVDGIDDFLRLAALALQVKDMRLHDTIDSVFGIIQNTVQVLPRIAEHRLQIDAADHVVRIAAAQVMPGTQQNTPPHIFVTALPVERIGNRNLEGLVHRLQNDAAVGDAGRGRRDLVFKAIIAAEKILVCHRLPEYMNEIALGPDIDADIAPLRLLHKERTRNRAFDAVKFEHILAHRNGRRALALDGAEEFLHGNSRVIVRHQRIVNPCIALL